MEKKDKVKGGISSCRAVVYPATIILMGMVKRLKFQGPGCSHYFKTPALVVHLG